VEQGSIKCPKCGKTNNVAGNYCLDCGTLLKPSLVDLSQKCPFCQFQVTEKDSFCPNCGRKIREKALSSTIWKQISIYLLSFLLPPLGLWPGFKYLKQKEQKLKNIGIVAIILTFLSLIIGGIIGIRVANEVNRQVNEQVQNLMQLY
jgi:uncharacterized OB-fold protein